jgi:hypothetical protein
MYVNSWSINLRSKSVVGGLAYSNYTFVFLVTFKITSSNYSG